tara:strand:- start:257 stop:562 length:306 start_codon:yes stop_codon:yes gene_type:complete
MGKSKKQIKAEQANMQSDALEMSSDGIQYSGDFTYTFSDLDSTFDLNNDVLPTTSVTVDGLSFDNEEELRLKYPALQDAWDHYKNIKNMCEQKEKEDENQH